MKRENGGFFWLFLAVLLVSGLVLQSCAGGQEAGAGGGDAPKPPQPTANHALHLENELSCIDCHDPEETGDPKIPVVETCFGCHELEEEADNVKAYFDKIRQSDGSYVFPQLSYSEGLHNNHAGHAEAGVECADCHGEPAATPFVKPDPMTLKTSCLSCHEVNEAPRDCATCHANYRKDQKPASHLAAGFLAAHGEQAPEGWKAESGMSSCSQCHQIPQDCNTCHLKTQPQSHREIGFLSTHGIGDTDAREQPFEETSCSLCHQESSCVQCHHVQMPRSHTNPFRRRLHGVAAEIDRESCRTCHKQNFCTFCHQTTAPITHRGNWSESHCVTCHDPLPSTSCYVCHKNTLGHLTATPLPPGPPHDNAIDAACVSCHPNAHYYDGSSCRKCHR